MKIDCAGESLELFAERAIHWPRLSSLIIADTHFGKAATFRHAGIPVPEQTTIADLERLSGLLDQTKASHLIILGDLLHAKTGKKPEVVEAVSVWREAHQDLAITLVKGNHDRSSGEPPAEWKIEVEAKPIALAPFFLAHEPHQQVEGLYTLAGHIHPSVSISDGIHRSVRLPCFSFGEHSAILPSFGSFTGSYEIDPKAGDRIFVIADEEVISLPVIRTDHR